MYMLVCNFVSIASALFYVYACMLGCMYVCELGGSFARGSSSLAYIYICLRMNFSLAAVFLGFDVCP